MSCGEERGLRVRVKRAAAPQSAVPLWPADQVERRAVPALIPYARNARTHSDEQIGQIAASIREWGWTVPVLVDEAGTIIAGHCRVLAAQKLGLADVPVMVARGWSEAQRRAYVIADNKLAENAGWDEALLGVELRDLAASGFDALLTGVPELKLTAFMNGDAPPDGFRSLDENLPTEHSCPRCGYRWSGSPNAAGSAADKIHNGDE
jgi:hypothetical protein